MLDQKTFDYFYLHNELINLYKKKENRFFLFRLNNETDFFKEINSYF